VDEARQVLDRLARIDALRAAGAEPGTLLAELRALLREGEAWAAAEGPAAGGARGALAALGDVLAAADAGAGEALADAGGSGSPAV
jgi:hypothetical protein